MRVVHLAHEVSRSPRGHRIAKRSFELLEHGLRMGPHNVTDCTQQNPPRAGRPRMATGARTGIQVKLTEYPLFVTTMGG
jgi:hypothetical protein